MRGAQLGVSFYQTNQIFAGLNRTYSEKVISVYPVIMSHSLKFLIVADLTKVGRGSDGARGHFGGLGTVAFDDVATPVCGEGQDLAWATGRMPHRETQLRSAAAIEGLRQVFERKIVNAHDNG